MKYIDVHAHYDDDKFQNVQDDIIEKIHRAGIEYVINAGSSIENSRKALEIAKKYEKVYCTVGIHPENVDEVDNLNELEEIIQSDENDRIVAIGEIGLDYHYGKETKDKQIELFKKQIDLAIKHDMPIQIHSRDAVDDMVEIVKNVKMPRKVMFHCYELNQELTKIIVKRGYSVSLGGNITYKRKEEALEQIREIPIEKIMLETDSPYLAPEPVRGTVNDSSNIPIICKRLAEIKGVDEEEIAEVTYNNAITFYNLK